MNKTKNGNGSQRESLDSIRERCDRLIDYLETRTIYKYNGDWDDELIPEDFEEVGVMIGDVLSKVEEKYSSHRHNFQMDFIRDTSQYWKPLGFKNSLNKILSGEIVEKLSFCGVDIHGKTPNNSPFEQVEIFKDKDKQALFEFLWDIFKDKIK